jgi:hypothetical protein
MEKNIEARFDRVFSKIAALNPGSIADTVFSRPPLFFSLCILLDSTRKIINAKQVEKALFAIDEILHSDVPLSERKKEEAAFISACTASTQRIKNRMIRNRFIGELLGI